MNRMSKPNHKRIELDIENLKGRHVVLALEAIIGGEFVALIIQGDKDIDRTLVSNTFN